MVLVTLGFIHYAPKGSEEGIKELILAHDMAQAIAYIDKDHFWNRLAEDDSEDVSFSPDEEWWAKNEHKRSEATALGLKIDEEFGDVSGTGKALAQWLEHDYSIDTSDAYYGVTHWNWNRHQEIMNSDAEVLLRLGLVKDIRNWKPE